jgi:ribosome-associated protein
MNRKPPSERGPKAPGISIPDNELEFTFARSSGPGGQNVNKVETKVSVSFNFTTSRVLSWEEKGRLGRHPSVLQNLSGDGALVVTSQEHRSQTLNREEAMRKLYEILRQALRPPKKRIPTKKTRASERERLAAKRSRSASKKTRRSVDPYSDE